MKRVSSLAALLTLATAALAQTRPPSPDPRVGLAGGYPVAATAAWNMRLVSNTPPSAQFFNPALLGSLTQANSDLSFVGHYVIQGNFNGYQVWDVANPAQPSLYTAYVCPGSQADVSVYRSLMFVSSEANNGRTDCGTQGVADTVSAERARGIRIFDITDLAHPRPLAVVQTCRGSHTHTVVASPRDTANVYVYISGSAGVRSPNELPGCSALSPDQDPNSARFRIEVIQVPLANPAQAHVVSSPRIFQDLGPVTSHGQTAADSMAAARTVDSARAAGGYIVRIQGRDAVVASATIAVVLDSVVRQRGGTGAPTAADSAQLRGAIQAFMDRRFAAFNRPRTGPEQCHDITVYPAIDRAGGACGGYGLLLDITDVRNPRRIGAAADSNFSFWHSATFNNDGTKLLFSDEWGGGTQPRCRTTDKPEWGADAIFTLSHDTMTFRSYFKIPDTQTPQENCVAHNGSLIPVPGRDIMVQGWYQGGVSVFDWTDANHPLEIAFFDRGPLDTTKLTVGGSWSAYWYNGLIYSSEIARGLDVYDLQPSGLLTQNEIDAAKTARLDFLNVQSQPRYTWAPSFMVARAYLDQLEREHALSPARIAGARNRLAAAERQHGAVRRAALLRLTVQLGSYANGSPTAAKVRALAAVVHDIGS